MQLELRDFDQLCWKENKNTWPPPKKNHKIQSDTNDQEVTSERKTMLDQCVSQPVCFKPFLDQTILS